MENSRVNNKTIRAPRLIPSLNINNISDKKKTKL